LGNGTSSGSWQWLQRVRLPALSSGTCMEYWHRGQAKMMSMTERSKGTVSHALA
jgi:hypothetical protein